MRKRHGHAVDGQNTPEYRVWIGMKSRCFNPNKNCHAYYAGRGITMCEEWRNDFMAFFNHIGPRPTPKHTVDRHPNNDGNYEPGNVCWATRKEQVANRRSTRFVMVDGEKRPLSDVIRERNLNRRLVCSRIEHGWTPERAISIPSTRSTT